MYHTNELLPFSEGNGQLKFELYQLRSLRITLERVKHKIRELKVSAPHYYNGILSRSDTSYLLVLCTVEAAEPLGQAYVLVITTLYVCVHNLFCICSLISFSITSFLFALVIIFLLFFTPYSELYSFRCMCKFFIFILLLVLMVFLSIVSNL